MANISKMKMAVKTILMITIESSSRLLATAMEIRYEMTVRIRKMWKSLEEIIFLRMTRYLPSFESEEII